MQLINNNLKTLYSFLKKKKTDYYFVSTSDEFLNEYVPDYNMRLKWLTNFSGSNGYALVSEKKNFFLLMEDIYNKPIKNFQRILKFLI